MKDHLLGPAFFFGIWFCLSTANPLCAASDAPRAMQVVALEDAVNIRSAPDMESPIVGRVWRGVRMEVLDLQKGWLRVEFSTGEQGWIAGDFVETVPSAEQESPPAASVAAPEVRGFETEAPYRIQVGDDLSIKSYRYKEINDLVTVRPDGYISLLLLDDLKVIGMTPPELNQLLRQAYRQHFSSPDVTVIVKMIKDVQERRVYVGGAVGSPKEMPLRVPVTVIQAIINAGGFQDTAKRKNVILMRKGQGEEPLIHSLDLRDVEGGGPTRDNLYLQPFDIVYVPTKEISKANLFVKQYINSMIPEKLSVGFSWFRELP